MLPFGELVLARRPGAQLQKSQTQFVRGCWLGRDSHTDEHVVGSKAGVFRTRTIRRLTEDRSWSTESVADMEWTPWKTAATTRGRPQKAVVGDKNKHIWNAPLPAMPSAYREPPPRPAARDAKSVSDKPEIQEVSLPDSDDEAGKRSPMDEESTSVPNPGTHHPHRLRLRLIHV